MIGWKLLINVAMKKRKSLKRGGNGDHNFSLCRRYHMNFHILHSKRLSLSLHCKQWLELSSYTLQCQTYLIILVLHSRLASWASGNTSDVYSVKSCDIDTGVTAESRLLHLTRLWWGCHHIKGKGWTWSTVFNAERTWGRRNLLFVDGKLRKKLNNLSKYPQAWGNTFIQQHTQ